MRLFSKHYAIERFLILFLVLFLSLCALTGTIVSNKIANDRFQVRQRAIYTTDFETSLSCVTGSVNDVFVNEARTKAFVLLSLSDMTTLPLDASKYQMFVTGSTSSQSKAALKGRPGGRIYLFGSTGYCGIYLNNAGGFENQILDVVVRVDSGVKAEEGPYLEQSGGDGSFATYDQFRVYFNPAGELATHGDFLEASELDIYEMYEEVATRPEEKRVREQLDADLENMLVQQQLITEYTSRLMDNGLSEPLTPAEIEGDRVVAYSNDGTELTYSKNGTWVDEGNNVYGEGEYYLTLETEHMVPGGFSFDWRSGSVKSGYLDQISGNMDWAQFMDAKEKEARVESTFSTDTDWYYSDGSVFIPTTDEEDEDVNGKVGASIQSYIEQLQAAWRAFYNYKVSYQTTDVSQLLYLEMDAAGIADSYTVNVSDSVITLW